MVGSMSSMKAAALALVASACGVAASDPTLGPRGAPVPATGLTTIKSPTGVTIRYKEPGKEGICETTPGVNSYSGYIDLSPTSHTFFWFFESRSDPANDPITLWLNGGPGSDSLIGLFQELGPCNITADDDADPDGDPTAIYGTTVNPYSWNEVSNLLFLSQPLGVGFSYSEEEPGSYSSTGELLNASEYPPNGVWPDIDPQLLDTTDLAAVSAWHVLQGFYSALPQLDSEVKSKVFNLFTESYGGHYGPAFYNYFYEQNEKIANATLPGYQLNFNALGIGNGIIDVYIQAPSYPEFAVNNTYGIKAYNDDIFEHANYSLTRPEGCLDQIEYCRSTGVDPDSEIDAAICARAANMCRDNVEMPYHIYGNRNVYDIRVTADEDPMEEFHMMDFLNLGYVQNALGVSVNYTMLNEEVFFAFQQTGDLVYPNFMEDLEMLLDEGVRVALYYGDADYICNWFGGEAVSEAVNYAHTLDFLAADYEPFTVYDEESEEDVEYGEVRQFGNFSFLRIYEAGHLVPYYQPLAALAMFNRTINGFNIANGTLPVTADLTTHNDKDDDDADDDDDAKVAIATAMPRAAAFANAPTPTPRSPNKEVDRRDELPHLKHQLEEGVMPGGQALSPTSTPRPHPRLPCSCTTSCTCSGPCTCTRPCL